MVSPKRWLSILSVNSLMLFNVSFPVLMLPNIVNGGEVVAQTDPNAEAERLLMQGLELFKQETAESQRQAIAKWEEALLLFRKTGDLSREASLLLFISRVYDSLGEKQKALNYFQQALPLIRQVKDRPLEAATLNNIGGVYDSLGEKQKALNYYQQALPLMRQVEDRRLEALIINKIGVIYHSLGEKQKALNYFQQALPLIQQIRARRGEVMAPNVEAERLFKQGFELFTQGTAKSRKGAIAKWEKAVLLFRKTGHLRREATTLNNIGLVLLPPRCGQY